MPSFCLERGLLHLCQLCAKIFSLIDLRLWAWYNNLGGQPPYNLPCLPLSKNSWSVYHKDPLLPRGSIQKKVPKTLLTRVYRRGIMIVRGARTLSWFLCASLWDTVSFLTMHTWLFLYAAMIQDIITISKINLQDKCLYPHKESFHLAIEQEQFIRAVWRAISGAPL